MIIDHKWIENNLKGKYTINNDGSYNVDGDVYFSDKNVTKIDVKFNVVNGYFDCSWNKISSLKGCPNVVNGDFSCYGNQLTSLEWCPNEVNGNFSCYANPISSLPNKIIKFKKLYCYDVKLPFNSLTYEEYLAYMMTQSNDFTNEQKHDIMKNIANDLF